MFIYENICVHKKCYKQKEASSEPKLAKCGHFSPKRT